MNDDGDRYTRQPITVRFGESSQPSLEMGTSGEHDAGTAASAGTIPGMHSDARPVIKL